MMFPDDELMNYRRIIKHSMGVSSAKIVPKGYNWKILNVEEINISFSFNDDCALAWIAPDN
ncbi:hypothetical protein AM629_13050 [Photorhabdus heterorhabditis]|uniref:Uncharacterized protein n=1 Tax=Photorhabdus heterorhabditis TaxID=880156 RepID=A0ABR5KAF7_9GAMM|nr:hypothetical protein AM629_13050 [Photorhabdus heterorhabditis]